MKCYDDLLRLNTQILRYTKKTKIKNGLKPGVAFVVAVSLVMLFGLDWIAASKTDELFSVFGLLLPQVSIEIKLSQMTESPTLYGFTIDKIVHTLQERMATFYHITLGKLMFFFL